MPDRKHSENRQRTRLVCVRMTPAATAALLPWAAGFRASTPNAVIGGKRTIHVQRCCNGCGESIGDVTDEEIVCGMEGRDLPDVRSECPRCAPSMAVSGG